MAAQAIAPPSGNRIWIPVGRENRASPAQPEAVRSVLNIPGHMHFGSFVWDENRIPKGRLWMRVDLTHQLMSVFRGGHEIGTAVILYGADSKATPAGSFTILEKDAHHISRSYDAPMPYMLRLTTDGVAIHGSNVRQGWATHGCIGVPLDFARLLFAAANKGDLVIILPQPGDDNTQASRVGSNRKADVR
ncbi:MAG: L,D-transpeptidase family protein [Alphaproteobacteria bacterium]|nr:L,D-transpeptidase family protein [Alphaproteobacteria bacterium]